MRFYAGIPLKAEGDTLPIGTLCVLDTVPRQLTATQLRALEVLGRQVMTQIRLRSTLEREQALTLELEQQRDKLLRVNTKLRSADESKDLFLAMLSHELRNPLSALSNGLSLLDASSAEDSLQQDTVQMMQRQCAQLTRLLDDLLDVSRISRGKVSLTRDTIALAPVLRDAFNALAGDAQSKQIQLYLGDIPETVWVEADGARLQQVVVNLLHNAIRYTPSGGRVSLDATVIGPDVLIRVTDTGQGIVKQDLNKIFDLFVQLDNAGVPANHGLGLGLALVNELVSLHGGSVDVHSDGPGCGSRFSVQLPLTNAPADTDTDTMPDAKMAAEMTARMTARITADAPPSTPADTLDVLITDDNLDSITALGRLLERRRHGVRLATSGSQALQAANQQKPDVILLDIGLPDISGHDLARRFREDFAGQPLLLIATTGYGQAEDRARSASAGFDHHLTKPVDLAQLDRLIHEYREQQRN